MRWISYTSKDQLYGAGAYEIGFFWVWDFVNLVLMLGTQLENFFVLWFTSPAYK